MRQSHGPQRKQQPCLPPRRVRPATRWPYRKNDVLDTVIPPRPHPGGKHLRRHFPASAIHQHHHWLGPPLPLAHPVEECLLGLECLSLAMRKCRTAPKIQLRQLLKGVLRAGPRSNMGERKVHGEENTAHPPWEPRNTLASICDTSESMLFLEYRAKIICNSILGRPRHCE